MKLLVSSSLKINISLTNFSYASFPQNEVIKTDTDSVSNPFEIAEIIPLIFLFYPIIYVVIRLIKGGPVKKWEKVILKIIGIVLIALFNMFMEIIVEKITAIRPVFNPEPAAL